MENKNFYVFLDIDNTMYAVTDYKSVLTKHYADDRVSNESADALNYLLFSLQNSNYNPILVITSGDRRDWEACQSKLYSAGLDKIFKMIKLPINKKLGRWDRIGVMLHDDYKNKFNKIFCENRKYTIFDALYFNYYKKCNNFLVIQSSMDNVGNNVGTSRYINIAIGDELSKNKVDLFLARDGITADEAYWNELKRIGAKKNHKVKSYFTFLKEKYQEFKVVRKKQVYDEMIESASQVKSSAQHNKKIRLHMNKNSNMHSDKKIEPDIKTNQELEYPLIPLEEESKFDWER